MGFDRFLASLAVLRLALGGLVLIGWAAAEDGPAIAPEAAARPNVILCMADDLGWGDVGFNGNRSIRTPHLDDMARAGLRFERFYSGAPVCSPTRGSALTGRHPYRYGVLSANVGHLPPGEITLAEILRENGYRTGHFGKWHLGTLTRTERDSNRGGPGGAEHYSPPQANGFDVCFSTEAKVPTWDPMVRPRGRSGGGTWWDPVGEPSEAEPYGTAYWNEQGEKVLDNLRGDDSRIIVDRAIPFIRSAVVKGRPFLAVVWFHAPHLPVVSGPEHAAPYRERDKYHQHYYGCVTALDEQIGRLRRELRALDVASNTLLWFCSDNGPEGQAGSAPGSAGPFRGRKRSLHEGGIRVPALLEWPGKARPGTSTSFPAVTSDYLPTVLDALGLRLPDSRPIDGLSLLPAIEGRDLPLPRPRPIAFESQGQLALSDNRYKLVRVPRGRSGAGPRRGAAPDGADFELYDLLADPSETKDLSGEHAGVVREMASRLAAWRESCRRSRRGDDYPAGAR